MVKGPLVTCMTALNAVILVTQTSKMKCKECYKKNFYLARDMQKIYRDIEKTIWECPDCLKRIETANFIYSD